MSDSILPDPSPPEAEQRRMRWRDRALLLAPVLAFGAVVLTLWIAVAWYLVAMPRERLDEQRHELATGVRAIALQTEPVLRQAEQAMRVVDLWLLTRGAADPLADPSLRELVLGVRSSSRQLVDIAVVDTTGRLHRLRGGPEDGASIAGTPAFEQVSGLVSEGITLGPPLRLSSRGAEGPLQLPLLMPLSRPLEQGHLVLALIDLQGLLQVQGPLSTGPRASLVMLRGDGLALARRPEVAGFVGRNLFDQYPSARQGLVGEQGFFNSSGSATDGLPRVGAFVTLSEFGIKLLLSDSQDAALARHERQRSLVLAIAIAATLGLMLLGHRLMQLQRAARLREAMMQATSQAMPLGLFRCDETGRIVYANDNYLRVQGLRREDLDWGWTTLVEPDHRGMLIQRWKHQVAAGEPVHTLRQIRRADDGRLRWIETRTAPLLVDGRVAGQAGSVADVTERGDQEKARQTLNAIFDMTPDFIAQTRDGGELTYLNPAARERLGLAADAPLDGLSIAHHFSAEQLALYDRHVLPTLKREGHWRGRFRMQLGDTRVPMDCLILLHREGRGAQRERERSEAMLLAVAHTARAQFIVGDTQQRVIFFNAAFEQARGVQLADWVGRPLAELFGPADHSQRAPLIAAALAGEARRVDLAVGSGRDALSLDVQYGPLRVHSGDIEGVIAIEVDVTDARREQAQLRLASQTDALTQTLNRSGFEETARRALAGGGRLALLCLDLDRFKPVNDTHGHPTGDALLKAVALRLRHALRPTDLVARLGGDEFAVLLKDLHAAADAATMADKLVQAVAAPYHIGELELSIGVSVGYSVVDGGGATLEQWVAAADANLYEAKRAGRGVARGGPLAG